MVSQIWGSVKGVRRGSVDRSVQWSVDVVRVVNHWLLALEELLHDLYPQNEEKQYGRQIHPFSFESSPLLTNVEHLFRQTNS